MALYTLVLAFTMVGLATAISAIFPLQAIRALAPTSRLKWAWSSLTAALVVCLGFRTIAALIRLRRDVDASDLLDAFVHLIGPSFVLGTALLAKNTAREVSRVASLERIALTDPLTDLWNRRRFDLQLQIEVTRASRFAQPLHLTLIDIDLFKQINDGYGHGAGDECLKSVGTMIVSCIRRNDFACRIGGDEFGVISPGLDAAAASAMVERLRRDMASTDLSLGGELARRVTISVGSAMLAIGDTAEGFLRRADQALYEAKGTGRNRVALAA